MRKTSFRFFIFSLVGLISFFAYNESAIALGSLSISSATVSSNQNILTLTGTGGGGITTTSEICPNSPPPRRPNPEIPGDLSGWNYSINNGSGGSGIFNASIVNIGRSASCSSIDPASETTYNYSFNADISALPNGAHTVRVCAQSSDFQVCDDATFTKSAKPKLGLSKYQSILICNSSNLSTCTTDALWTLNNQTNTSAPVMNWNNTVGGELAYSSDGLIQKLFSIFFNKALAITCSGSGFLSSRLDSLCGGSGLVSSGQSAGSLAVVNPTQVTKMNYNYRATITGFCSPLISCETGSQTGTLDVIFKVEGPITLITANGQPGTVSITAGSPVALNWSSSNVNATNPLTSCSFGCTTPTGSQTVFPLVTTTYTIKVKGISDIATEANGNYATSSVTVVVGAATPSNSFTPTPTSSTTPTPTPSALSCSPTSQIVNPNQQANLSSNLTSGTNSWSASGGIPPSGTGNNFNTRYSSTGTKTVTLTNSSVPGSSAQCIVQVVDSNPPPTSGDVRCEPSSQTVSVGQQASLTGDDSDSGFYSWLSGGGIPLNGFTNGSVPFQPIYSAAGDYLITVWDTFNPTDYNTCTVSVVAVPNSLPSVPTITATEPNYCTSGPAVTINWTYLDPNGDPQSAYQVQIDDQGSFNSPEVDSGKVLSGGTSYFSGQGFLLFNTTYRSRVRVWDSSDSVSAWKVSSTWKTPAHAYPLVNFGWSPASPKIDQPVQFIDSTTFYDGGGSRTWSWLFGDGGNSSVQNPLHTYSAPATYNVTETATDKDGFTCSISHPVSVSRNIPTWKEVNPK